MSVGETPSEPPTRPAGYWPLWSSAALLAAGAILVLAETANLLVFVGVGFVGVGLYGLTRRPSRVANEPGGVVLGTPQSR